LLLKHKKRIAPTILFLAMLAGCVGNQVAIKEKSQALANLGNALAQQGDLRGGLKRLIEASKLDPENANIHNELGLAYSNLRAFQKSMIHFNEALKLQPDFPEAYNNLGTLYLLLKKWDLAIDCFRKASSYLLYKTPHFAQNNMGLAYHNKGDYQKAIEHYQKAIKLFPSYSPCYENLARAYEAINNWEPAIEAYKKSIDYDPGYPASHLNLARLYLRLNRANDAVIELKLTIELDPKGRYGMEARRLLKQIKIVTTQ
jgi:tetratricopeptide (TPR) repeat protein